MKVQSNLELHEQSDLSKGGDSHAESDSNMVNHFFQWKLIFNTYLYIYNSRLNLIIYRL